MSRSATPSQRKSCRQSSCQLGSRKPPWVGIVRCCNRRPAERSPQGGQSGVEIRAEKPGMDEASRDCLQRLAARCNAFAATLNITHVRSMTARSSGSASRCPSPATGCRRPWPLPRNTPTVWARMYPAPPQTRVVRAMFDPVFAVLSVRRVQRIRCSVSASNTKISPGSQVMSARVSMPMRSLRRSSTIMRSPVSATRYA